MPAKPLDSDTIEKSVAAVSAAGGNVAKAARATGIARQTLQHHLKLAAKKGLAPGHTEAGVAPGFSLKYLKVHRDADGQVKQTWECQTPEISDAIEAYERYLDNMVERVTPLKPIKAPKGVCNEQLLTQYMFTDYHLNMLAWELEGGDNWDLGIADRVGRAAMDYLVDRSPPSDTGIVVIQGDWHHSDSMKSETPTSGHPLDSDSRPGKAIETSLDLIEHLTARALQKHKNVVLLICEGNHDIYTSLMIRKHFRRLFRDNKRVEVLDREIPYYAYQWGETALFYHHGHMKGFKELPLLFAAMFPKIWGNTTKRYGNMGHYHHEKRDEFSGIKIYQHPTMAANDGYGARGGYMSLREMSAMVFHKKFGRGSEIVVTPEMVFEPE